MILKHTIKAILASLLFAVCGCNTGLLDGPYQATGIKIGEVTDETAIVWTRLTRHPERVGSAAPMPEILYRDLESGELIKKRKSRPNLTPVVNFPEGSTIQTIEGAVQGTQGKVRVLYRMQGASGWEATRWHAVHRKRDYTHQFRLTNLKPNAKYQVCVEARASAAGKKGAKARWG